MELVLTFGYNGDEYNGDVAALAPGSGLTDDDLQALAAGAQGAELSLRPGSVGKGYAGPGIQLVVDLGERALNDGASLFAWGTILWGMIRRVQQGRQRRLEVQDPQTIGALAAGSNPGNQELLRGSFFSPTICLTGGGPGLGTDSRDVWATPIMLADERLLVLLTAPSGRVLHEVTVTPEWLLGK